MSETASTTRTRTLEWSDPVATAAAGAELAGIDYMRALIAGELPAPPIAITMNMGPIELEEGRVVFAGIPGEEHGPTVGDLSYAERRTDVIQWLTEHGWEASAATIPDVVAHYRQGVVEANETSSVPSILISGYRAT